MQLDLAHCSVRSWRDTDVAALARAADDRSIWINLRDRFPHPYTQSDAVDFVERCATADPQVNFAIAVDDVVVGSVGLILGDDIYRLSAEVGYWLAADARGKGIASEALRGFSDWAFERFGLVRLHAAVFTWNPASARVLEKAGFERESTARCAAIKDGRVVDEWVYAKVRER